MRRSVLVRLIWSLVGLIPGGLLGVWLAGYPLSSWEEAAKIAPIGTAAIAAVAVSIAFAAMLLQKDIAKRRAAIDFFLKSEMDPASITAYENFEKVAANAAQLVAQQGFGKTHPDYAHFRHWLNVCELIAVGVNKDAFSERVALDYWGDVLPTTFNDAKPFITFVRETYKTPESFVDLETLVKRWTEREASTGCPSRWTMGGIMTSTRVLTPNQWIALGTWVLAAGTIWLALDAKYSSERQLRAYVYATPFRAFNIDDRQNVAQAYTTIGSKGATFAHDVERSVGISLLPGPTPAKFSDLGALNRLEGKLVIPPGADGFVIQNLRALTKDELDAITTPDGKMRLYAFGKITYKDDFGWPHWTTFCHAYFGPERSAFNAGFAYKPWQAKYCDRFNETDE
jgi:hypothetical protein